MATGLYVVAGSGWWICAVSVDLRVVVCCCCRPVTAAAVGFVGIFGFCNTDNGMCFDQRLQSLQLQRVVDRLGVGGGDVQFTRVIWRIFVNGRTIFFRLRGETEIHSLLDHIILLSSIFFFDIYLITAVGTAEFSHPRIYFIQKILKFTLIIYVYKSYYRIENRGLCTFFKNIKNIMRIKVFTVV